MTTGIVDTTVLIHLARGNVNANQWLASQVDLAVTSTSWLEFVFGAQSKARQVAAIQLLNTFELLFLNPLRSKLGNATTDQASTT